MKLLNFLDILYYKAPIPLITLYLDPPLTILLVTFNKTF